jgi:hypothetical protein
MIPLIVGLVVGLVAAVWSGFRAATGSNEKLRRNPDGSVYGGLVQISAMVGVMWLIIAAALTWLVMLPF